MLITIYFCQENVEKPKLCSLNGTLNETQKDHIIWLISVHILNCFFFFPCGYMWSMGSQCLLNESFIQEYNKYTVMWLMLDELLSVASPLSWQWTHFLWTRYCCISYFPFDLYHWQCFNWICRDNGWNSLVAPGVFSSMIGRSSVAFEISNSFKAEKRLRSTFKYLNMVAVLFSFSLKPVPSENKALEMSLWTLYVTCFYLGLLQQMALLLLRSFVCIECIVHC